MIEANASPYTQDPIVSDRIEDVRDRWSAISVETAKTRTPGLRMECAYDGTPVFYADIAPGNDYDPSEATVLCLPYLNGFTTHHFIRAKVLQEVLDPEGERKRMIVLPNNNWDGDAYTLTKRDKERLAEGSIRPIVEKQVSALENIPDLSRLALTGYSAGGRNALGIAAEGSTKFEVSRVNADESPSKQARSREETLRDFMLSGGDLAGAIDDSEIDPLIGIKREVVKGVLPFVFKMLTPQGRATGGAMKGSIVDLALDARENVDRPIKLGYIEGSKLFDPNSLPYNFDSMFNIREYRADEGYRHKHATGDNVIAHAVMAYQGLRI